MRIGMYVGADKEGVFMSDMYRVCWVILCVLTVCCQCVCVFVCVCMHVCIPLCMHSCKYQHILRMYVLYVCMYMYVCICMYVMYLHVQICIFCYL
jgi:hypothetical protein